MNLHMRRVCFLSSSKFVWGAQAGPIKFNGSRQKCIVFGGQVSAFALVQNKKHTPRFMHTMPMHLNTLCRALWGNWWSWERAKGF